MINFETFIVHDDLIYENFSIVWLKGKKHIKVGIKRLSSGP